MCCFLCWGAAASLLRSDLKMPSALYETLSIFLLIAIGLKGGVELAKNPLMTVLPIGLPFVLIAALIPLLAFPVLHYLGKFSRPDSASIAAHYGSVSVVTFAVGVTFLGNLNVSYEGYIIVFLVLLEFPALMLGVLLARWGQGIVLWGSFCTRCFSARASFSWSAV